MEAMPRHQCVIYDGSPAKMLPAIAAHIQQKLSENFRCFYLNSPTMVTGIKSYLYAAGVDVTYEVAKTSLILSSDQSQLKNGYFDIDFFLGMLEEAVNEALRDGYKGLWATGDMTWELGPDRDVEKLLEYEWRLEKLFQKYPTLSGICQYHANSLPQDIVFHGLLTHPALFINETLAHVNPHYISSKAPIQQTLPTKEMELAIHNICAIHSDKRKEL